MWNDFNRISSNPLVVSRSTPSKRKPPYFWLITTSQNHSIIFSKELDLTSKDLSSILRRIFSFLYILFVGFYQNHNPCLLLYAFLSRSTHLKRKPPYLWFITTSPKGRNHSIVLIGSNVKGSQFHFKKEFLTEVLDYEYDKSIRDVSTSTPPSLFNRLVQKASIKFLLKIGRLSFLLQNK